MAEQPVHYLTVEEVRLRLAAIEAVKGDCERAHGLEDELYVDFIRYVVEHPSDVDLYQLAKEVLNAEKIEFERWYA